MAAPPRGSGVVDVGSSLSENDWNDIDNAKVCPLVCQFCVSSRLSTYVDLSFSFGPSGTHRSG